MVPLHGDGVRVSYEVELAEAEAWDRATNAAALARQALERERWAEQCRRETEEAIRWITEQADRDE